MIVYQNKEEKEAAREAAAALNTKGAKCILPHDLALPVSLTHFSNSTPSSP
jgi:hypothetical protein